jgi:hypothetical protein
VLPAIPEGDDSVVIVERPERWLHNGATRHTRLTHWSSAKIGGRSGPWLGWGPLRVLTSGSPPVELVFAGSLAPTQGKANHP